MSVELARRRFRVRALVADFWTNCHADLWRCRACLQDCLAVEAAALALDLAVAERHAAPASPLARALAVWGTRLAQDEGIAW